MSSKGPGGSAANCRRITDRRGPGYEEAHISYVRCREGPTQTKVVTQSLLLAILKGQPLQLAWGVFESGENAWYCLGIQEMLHRRASSSSPCASGGNKGLMVLSLHESRASLCVRRVTQG